MQTTERVLTQRRFLFWLFKFCVGIIHEHSKLFLNSIYYNCPSMISKTDKLQTEKHRQNWQTTYNYAPCFPCEISSQVNF